MQDLPVQWAASFERRLERARVAEPHRLACHKWIRFYLYFCQKFGCPATAPTALGPFLAKLAEKGIPLTTGTRLRIEHLPWVIESWGRDHRMERMGAGWAWAPL